MPDDSTPQAAPYTAWPTADDVWERLASIGVVPRGDTGKATTRIGSLAAAVTAEVEHRTHRQFIADPEDAPTTRTYDGSGTAELEIDPIVELTAVQIVGGYGTPTYLYDLSSVQVVQEQGRPQTRLTVGRGSLPAYATSAVLCPVYYMFPAGRQNIVVSGRFGYGATFPEDLWEAVCGEIALRLTQETLFQVEGRIVRDSFGDGTLQFALPEATATGWHSLYEQALQDYKRPKGAAMRKRTKVMI